MPTPTLAPLSRPPIFEVACGVWFTPIDDIDPVLLGVFWERLREDFPLRQVHDEIQSPGPGFHIEVGNRRRHRTWFMSENGEFVVQIQRDRFFLNWRSVGIEGRYPRFSSSPDSVLPRSVALFEQLSEFLEGTAGVAPHPQRVEVMKVDRFVEGRDWAGDDDLLQMMPLLKTFADLGPFRRPQPAFRLRETIGDMIVAIALEMQPVAPRSRHLRLTTTVQAPIPTGVSFREAASTAGNVANELFAAIVPLPEMRKRFDSLTSREAT